jgi:hypothetical protein
LQAEASLSWQVPPPSISAGGEGIDLQENCHSLIHIDLPWNPMRLHQRVGRLNRYGQARKVEVFTVGKPDTVEARIWDKLNAKIEQIMRARPVPSGPGLFLAGRPTITYSDLGGLQDAARLAYFRFTRQFTRVGKPSSLQKSLDVSLEIIAG